MLLLRRIAYLLIAASIGVAIPFSFTGLPDWLLLIGLFGARLYLLASQPNFLDTPTQRPHDAGFRGPKEACLGIHEVVEEGIGRDPADL